MKVTVTRTGRRFDAEAILELHADAATVWETITDYEALPDFMPGIHACRILEREPGPDGRERLVVEQKGEFRFLLFAQAMTVIVAIDHEPGRVADARSIRFDLGVLKQSAIESFDGRYEIVHPVGPGPAARVTLRYTAAIELKLPPPPAVGHMAVKHNLEAQLKAVEAEVKRRASRGARS